MGVQRFFFTTDIRYVLTVRVHPVIGPSKFHFPRFCNPLISHDILFSTVESFHRASIKAFFFSHAIQHGCLQQVHNRLKTGNEKKKGLCNECTIENFNLIFLYTLGSFSFLWIFQFRMTSIHECASRECYEIFIRYLCQC